MKSLYVLRNLEQIKVLANPFRLRILEVFGQKVMTTKQMAIELGENPTKLYHHVDALEGVGLIRLVRKKQNRGTTEKYYTAIAKEFIVDRGYLELIHDGRKVTSKYEGLFLNALRATLQEAKESVHAGLISPVKRGRNAFLYRRHISGLESEINAVMNKVGNLIRTCRKLSKRGQQIQFGLTIAFYPLVFKKKNQKKK